jgi:hypothetical protein
MRTAFRRRESDRETHNERMSRCQTNSGGTEQIESFPTMNFEFDTEADRYQLLFNKENLRQNTGFRELGLIDFPLDQL